MARLVFFEEGKSYPSRMLVQEGPPIAECFAVFLFLKPENEDKIRSSSAFRDLEPDGIWDQKIVFSGMMPGLVPFGQQPNFRYFERRIGDEWVEEEPPKGNDTLLEVLGF